MRPFLFAAVAALSLGAQAPPAASQADPFAGMRFLAGDWRGEGEGKPGQSTGQAGFRFELGGKALVRRSFADYPAANGRPPARHEDLMTFFAEGGQLKALYVDNEDHVIRYLVTEVPSGVAFTSEAGPGPRFRLTYLKGAEAGRVTLRFEIAPPGKPEAFATYLEGAMRKVP